MTSPTLAALPPSVPLEAGVVYTKPWVVELILDLVGYTSDKPLYSLVALEPSAGDGAFLRGMVRRIVESCRRHNKPLKAARDCLRAYEIDPKAIIKAVNIIRSDLISLSVPKATAASLANGWIRREDFLEASLGFPVADFVVGNPPYIRLEEIPEAKANMYRSVYATMRGRADIYIAFYQAALSQLKPGGVCGYICADRWLLNDYGKALREFITSGYSVRNVIECHDVAAFESEVSAYPAITIIAHEKQRDVYVGKALPGIESQPAGHIVATLGAETSTTFIRSAKFTGWFSGTEPWPCSSPDSLALLKRLESDFCLLESSETATTVGIGVATGADKIYISNAPPDIEKSRLIKMAMPFDLKAGQVEWSGHYMVNPWDKDGLVALADYPRMKTYLTGFETQLSQRHTAKKNRTDSWHRTIDRVNLDLLTKHKLYIPDIKEHLSPSLDAGETYPHHNIYWITSEKWDLRALAALLMSDVAEFFIRSYGVKMRGGYFRFQAQYLRKIRVPAVEAIKRSDLNDLIDAFQRQDRRLATQIAFRLYGIRSIP